MLAVLIGSLGSGAAGWPAGLEAAAGLDTGEALRRLRLAAAWAGPCELDCYLAGNGSTSATVLLAGPAGSVELTAEIGESGRALARLTVSPRS